VAEGSGNISVDLRPFPGPGSGWRRIPRSGRISGFSGRTFPPCPSGNRPGPVQQTLLLALWRKDGAPQKISFSLLEKGKRKGDLLLSQPPPGACGKTSPFEAVIEEVEKRRTSSRIWKLLEGKGPLTSLPKPFSLLERGLERI
jgi:hypothetical protein